ncbi:MAG TPA: carboxypeptidase-like regulatory domain-containing protein [Gemmatimonadaceae bacterium]|nr:carboxypeptidase-like regulatory domain-containing protein [Gemmatimonadaceae bacterium]
MWHSYRTGTLLLGALSLLAQASGAQVPAGRRELVGFVKDPRGTPVEGAIVEIPGTGTRTSETGLFRLFTREIDTVTLAIRRPGFSPIEALISANGRQWDTVMVEMEQVVTTLPSARVTEERVLRTGLKGFYERKEQAVSGIFVAREEIVARNTLTLSDVLQARRGVALVPIGGSNIKKGVRFATYQGTRGRNCVPDMWVDGQLAKGMEIDDLPANTVEGLELYDTFATVPMQFSHQGGSIPCGTIVVWTRPPDTRKP